MRSTNYSTAAILFTGLLFCTYASAQKFKVEYDIVPGTDFSKYKTYKWQRADKATYPDAENDALFMRTIDAELAAKGLVKTDNEAADIYAIYQIAVFDNVVWSSFRTEVGWGGVGEYNMPGLGGATTNSTSPVKIGSFILEIYDVAQKKRVWKAYIKKNINPGADFKKREKNTQKAMAAVMKNYPPVGR